MAHAEIVKIPICPYHRRPMIAHREEVPAFVQKWYDYPVTRNVFRCTAPGCPRIESADRDFHGSFGMVSSGDGYMSRIIKPQKRNRVTRKNT